jgi:hypothetical protein
MHELYKTEQRFAMLSIPLLLRLFEYIREEATTDEDLHFMAERIHELASDLVKMSMNQYKSIIPPENMRKPKQFYQPEATTE